MKLEYIILIILVISLYEFSLKDYIKEKKNREYIKNHLEVGSKIICKNGLIAYVKEINNDELLIVSGTNEKHSYMTILDSDIRSILS